MTFEFFFIGYLIFFISTFLLRVGIRKFTLKYKKPEGHKYLLWTSKYIFYVYLILLFASIPEYLLRRPHINLYVSISGLLLYCGGIVLRQWAFFSLKQYWSVHIEIFNNQSLITKGPYALIRHPNTVANLLEMTGMLLIPHAYICLAFFVLFYVPVIFLRALTEEKKLAEAMPDAYRAYRQQVKGLIPFIV